MRREECEDCGWLDRGIHVCEAIQKMQDRALEKTTDPCICKKPIEEGGLSKRERVECLLRDDVMHVAALRGRSGPEVGSMHNLRLVSAIDEATSPCDYCGSTLQDKYIRFVMAPIGDVRICLDRKACRGRRDEKTEKVIDEILACMEGETP